MTALLRLLLAAALAATLAATCTAVTFAQGDPAMTAAPAAAPADGIFNARQFGAVADGATDDTAALQAAIDEAALTGGQVYLPPGKYLVSGSLRVKPGVAVVGAAVAPLYIKPLTGTVIFATGGRDDETAPALFELGDSSAVTGLTVYYPEQKPEDIHPYAWTFHLQGGDNTVENVTLINSYNAIRVGPEGNVRHRIRSVYGCALRRGIFVDTCSDIGRVENVQFHCHWWSAPEVGGAWEPVFKFMWENCEAFIFGRTDWEYITNNFVFPVNIGYRFINTPSGACNGQMTGNGADAAQVCVQVDRIQPMGLLITNGQFVAFNGDDPTAIVINEDAWGQVRFVNCNFWGMFRRIAVLKGRSYVGFSDCYFSGWDNRGEGLPAIDAQAGKLQVQGCSFVGRLGINLGDGVQHAIITGNNGSRGLRITGATDKAIIRDNEPGPQPPSAAGGQYTVAIGSEDDDACLLGDWNGAEPAADGPEGSTTARWTGARAVLRLPVVPGTAYDLSVWVRVENPGPGHSVTVEGGESVALDEPGLREVKLSIPAELTAGKTYVDVICAAATWVPREVTPGSTDDRHLGYRVFSATVTAR
jgi:hypothetical protein